MQALIRVSETLPSVQKQLFIDAHSSGKLVKPEDAGYTIASLALNATANLSGEFVSWDSDYCAPYRRK